MVAEAAALVVQWHRLSRQPKPIILSLTEVEKAHQAVSFILHTVQLILPSVKE